MRERVVAVRGCSDDALEWGGNQVEQGVIAGEVLLVVLEVLCFLLEHVQHCHGYLGHFFAEKRQQAAVDAHVADVGDGPGIGDEKMFFIHLGGCHLGVL